MLYAYGSGFAVGLSLILAIGAQNAFVLRQGLARAHVFAVCLTCAVSDALLMAAGVSGFAVLLDALPWLRPAMTWAGAAFLLVYGALSFRAALAPGRLAPAATAQGSLKAALLTCLGITWLNPHVYLDTLVLVGSVSSDYPGHEAAFGAGAATASAAFFFALGYGARLLAPVFARPEAWRWLDLGIGVLMWSIAAVLVLG